MDFLSKIFEGWKSIYNAILYRFDDYEWNCDFWVEINIGYYEQYIFPYDDWYNPTISKERQLRLAQKPPTIYLSPNDFDSLMEKLNAPIDPAVIKRIEKIMKTPVPWEN